MFKHLLIVTMVLFSLVIFCEEYNASNYVPEKTMLYLEMENGSQFCEEMREIGLWQLFESQEWQAFFNTIPKEIIELLKSQQKNVKTMSGMDLNDIAQSFSSHLSFALIDVIPGQMPMPIALLSWDLGTQKEKIMSLVKNLYGQINPDANMEPYEYYGYEIFEIQTPMMPVYFTTMNNVWMMCTSKSHLENILSNKPQASLANNEQYKIVKEKVLRQKSGVLLYADVEHLVTLGLQISGEEKNIRPILEIIGLDAIKSLGLGLHFAKSQVVESLYLHVPERKGLLGKILPQKSTSKKLEKFIPNDLIAFQHSYVDFEGLVNVALEALEKFSPEKHEQFSQGEKELNNQLGINIRKDLLYNIGTEYLYTWSFSGGLIPDVAIQLTLEDSITFQNAVDKILQMVPKKYRYKFLWNGYHFQYFNFSSMSSPIPVAPTFVIDGDRILITLYPEMAKNLIMQKEGHFPQDMLNYIDERTYADIQYLNLEKLIVPIYRTILPFIQSMIPRSEVPIEFGLLPAANTVKKHLHNVIQLLLTDKDGFTLEYHSPSGVTPFIALIAAIGSQTKKQKFKQHDIEIEDTDYDDSEDTTGSSDLEFDLTGVQDSRAKKTDSKYASKLYFFKSTLKLSFWSNFPVNILSYGNFKINATDNLGNKLSYQPGFGLGKGKHKKIDSYTLKSLLRDKGMMLSVNFASPVREATSFTVKGSFEVKTAEFKKLEVKNYANLCKTQHEIKDIDGLTIKFTNDTKEKTITLHTSGKSSRIKTVFVKVGDEVIKSTSWSSYTLRGDVVKSYNFKKPIPSDANIIFEYADNVKTQTISIDLDNIQLP